MSGEGNYFTEYNREQLQRIFDAAREMGRTDITLKCADETCYREICRVLIDEQEIFSYIPDTTVRSPMHRTGNNYP